jgi:CheY-like chemotaxis protein
LHTRSKASPQPRPSGGQSTPFHSLPSHKGRHNSMTRLDGRRVMVVDDNQDAADTLAMLLELLGAEVRTVYDSPKAQGLFESFMPDLVLLDIGMPVMDGYEVARRIRASLKVTDATRLVAVTGLAKEDIRHLTLAAGFDDLLIKPVAMVDLERVIWKLWIN